MRKTTQKEDKRQGIDKNENRDMIEAVAALAKEKNISRAEREKTIVAMYNNGHSIDDIFETNRMITENKLDVRTITMGISLRDCAHPNITKFCQNIYDKITKSAEFLVKTGEDIETEYGIPIIHKRVSVTPIAIAADACKTDSYVPVAEAMDRAAKEVGINFIGGFSALVERGMSKGDRILIDSIAESLAVTDLVCSSVAVGSTKAEIGRASCRERVSSPV